MEGNELCPFDNTEYMYQFYEGLCNNRLNCWEYRNEGKQTHGIYLCVRFKGDPNEYLENWKVHWVERENEPEKR